MEIWKEIRGFEGKYSVSNFGRVKSFNGKFTLKFPSGYITEGTIDSLGYRVATMRKPGIRVMTRIHRLVAEAFLANPECKKYVNHKDSIRHNNHVDNLEWCTQKENIQHAVLNGNHNLKGENHPNSKMTKYKVIEMRKMRRDTNMSHNDLAAIFQISRRQVGDILNGKNWGWL